MQTKARHYTIPLFIPMQGCPHQCVFCNQLAITGNDDIPTDSKITEKIKTFLETIPKGINQVEVGFFGGSFTGLPVSVQEHLLQLVQPWLQSGQISGIRLSTRPDYVGDEVLKRLGLYGVTTIELGAQSLDDEVLRLSGRGHTASEVRAASARIIKTGFRLGLQMMTGLPGDTLEKSTKTAREIISLGARETRIYPALVVRNTNLEKLYLNESYKPQTLEEAVNWCSCIVPLFEMAGVKILRLGLHPSDGLMHQQDLLAGPFHVAFGELVFSEIWKRKLSQITPRHNQMLIIFVNPAQINQAVGHSGSNKKILEQNFKKVTFRGDDQLKKWEYYVDYR